MALFMKGTPQMVMCGNSLRALEALRRAGAPVTTVDVLPDPAIRQELSTQSGWPTIPQVFVRGELIGGADIVEELEASRRSGADARGEARPVLPRRPRGEDAHRHVLRNSLTSRTAKTGSVAAHDQHGCAVEGRPACRSRLRRVRPPRSRPGRARSTRACRRRRRGRASRRGSAAASSCPSRRRRSRARTPATNAPTRDHRGLRRAGRAARAGSRAGAIANVATRSRRCGRKRSISSPPQIRPTDSVARIAAPPARAAIVRLGLHGAEHQERAPRKPRSGARTGGRSPTARCASGTRCQPSASSRTKLGASARARSAGSVHQRRRRAPPTPNVAASMAIAQPGPAAATSDAAERGAEHVRAVEGQPQERVRLLDHGSAARSGGRSPARRGRRTRRDAVQPRRSRSAATARRGRSAGERRPGPGSSCSRGSR